MIQRRCKSNRDLDFPITKPSYLETCRTHNATWECERWSRFCRLSELIRLTYLTQNCNLGGKRFKSPQGLVPDLLRRKTAYYCFNILLHATTTAVAIVKMMSSIYTLFLFAESSNVRQKCTAQKYSLDYPFWRSRVCFLFVFHAVVHT